MYKISTFISIFLILQVISLNGISKLAIIGDFNSQSSSHQATNEPISHSCKILKNKLYYDWIDTEEIDRNFEFITHHYKAFWIAPGIHKNTKGILRIIEFARLNNIPTLGTCGGFQYMVLEFARNVLNIKDAEHAEFKPEASQLVISPLLCNIKGQVLEIKIIDKSSNIFSIFDKDNIYEKYYCNFGLNPLYQTEFANYGFKIVGVDVDNQTQVRILELDNHPFFIATLFVPQINSIEGQPHPLILYFLSLIR